MPITFEEVTAEVTPPETSSSTTPAPSPTTADDDFEANLQRALRLMAERAARLIAD